MPNKNDFNVWSKWDPLKKVMIGSCVGPEYFEHVANTEIKEKLQKMAIETQEDLDYIASICTGRNIEVIRAETLLGQFPKCLNPDTKAPRIEGILYPRNHMAVIGNNLLYNQPRTVLEKWYPEVAECNHLEKNTAWWELLVKNKISDLQLPSWTLVGSDLLIDMRDDQFLLYETHRKSLIQWAKKWLPTVSVRWVDVGAHTDGCFHTVKPGVIVSLYDIMKYEDTFPKWDVLYLPDQSWNAVESFLASRQMTKGKFWIPGEENNPELLKFINNWLDNWVGFVEETVFDVNMLMLDEHTACVSNYNKEVFDFFKKHKIEPIICPLRHRFFFDGGIHCVSLDLYRDGQCQSYIDYK